MLGSIGLRVSRLALVALGDGVRKQGNQLSGQTCGDLE